MHCVRLVIQGRVQGVGYRAFARARARALGLSGWVRNRPDGAVEVEAEGARRPLAELVDDLRRGPPAAEVTEVTELWSERDPCCRGFVVTF
jgi:acylphosphatase